MSRTAQETFLPPAFNILIIHLLRQKGSLNSKVLRFKSNHVAKWISNQAKTEVLWGHMKSSIISQFGMNFLLLNWRLIGPLLENKASYRPNSRITCLKMLVSPKTFSTKSMYSTDSPASGFKTSWISRKSAKVPTTAQ